MIDQLTLIRSTLKLFYKRTNDIRGNFDKRK